MSAPTYEERTVRNRGFLSVADQERLRAGSAFVCGVGGMGGAAVASLARAGVGRLTLADFDAFEPSNLNRQVFASTETLGRPKAEAAREAVLRIAPGLCIRTRGADWVEELDELLPSHDVVVNGMDDIRAAIALYRAARKHGVPVVDAYTSPLPSVTCVAPGDPVPEERLGYGTVGRPADALDDEDLRRALLAELSWVGAASGGLDRLEPTVIGEILRGERARSSFAPVVTIAGNLMAFEAIGALRGAPSGAGHRGYFVDPWSGRVRRPRAGWRIAWRRRWVARWLESLAGAPS